MPSKFSTRASSLLLSLLLVPGLRAQDEPPAATPASTRAPGHIRFWNMLPPTAGAMDLRRAGAPATEPPLTGKSPSYRYNSYLEHTPGVYHLSVNKNGQPTSPLKVLDVNLQGNFFYTVLVAPTAQGPSVQLINDTPNPKAENAVLTVRNYFPGLSVDLFNGTQKIVSALASGDSTVISNLPFDRLSLTIKTILPNKVPAESSAEADFKLARRATLLIIPDEYGRFRPRVTLDGTVR